MAGLQFTYSNYPENLANHYDCGIEQLDVYEAKADSTAANGIVPWGTTIHKFCNTCTVAQGSDTVIKRGHQMIAT